MSERKIVVTGAIGVAILVVVALLAIAVFGGRARSSGAQGGAVPAAGPRPAPASAR